MLATRLRVGRVCTGTSMDTHSDEIINPSAPYALHKPVAHLDLKAIEKLLHAQTLATSALQL